MGCIYRIVCHETGRTYVGQTAYSHPFYRYRQHQVSARNGEDTPLYDDMRLYAIGSFECIPICVTENENLNSLECYYAEQYNAYVWEGGYNVGECGKSLICKDVSDETRLWMKRKAILKKIRR